MRSSHKTGVRLGLVVSAIVYSGGKGSSASGPVEVRDEVEIFVERWLRLLVNYPENLVNGRLPCNGFNVNASSNGVLDGSQCVLMNEVSPVAA